MKVQLARAFAFLSLCLLTIARADVDGKCDGGSDSWGSTRIVDNSTASRRPHWSDGEQWWEAWPLPVSQAAKIEPDEVMKLLEDVQAGNDTARDFLLVDVRRADWKGGAITSSINVPAHAFYHARSMVYDLCKRANIKRIIFFCRSSNGRGPRCARWMQDYIEEVGGDGLESLVMRGGVKGWARTFGGRMMDCYDEEHWRQEDDE